MTQGEQWKDGRGTEADQVYTTRGHMKPILCDSHVVALAKDEATRQQIIAAHNAQAGVTQGERWKLVGQQDCMWQVLVEEPVAKGWRAEFRYEQDAIEAVAAHNAQAEVLTAIRSVADSFHIPGAYADPPRPVRELLVELGAKASEQADVLTALRGLHEEIAAYVKAKDALEYGPVTAEEYMLVADFDIFDWVKRHDAALERAAGGQIGEKKGKDI